jgi:pimeloyl-ACP methyl ester carboxylesterase
VAIEGGRPGLHHLAAFALYAASDKKRGEGDVATFVLVHGAFHGGWCWYKLAALLERSGHHVVAPDLPGHGRNPASGVTLDSYVDFVVDLLGRQAEPVVLVGHSMGGGIITAAAEAVPEKIARLVYLTAYLGPNGSVMSEELAALAASDGMIAFGEDAFALLYQDCSAEDRMLARLCLTPQAAAPLLAPILWTPERWGRVPRAFIGCRDDLAFAIDDQRACAEAVPGTEFVELEAGHSSFFSMPRALADALEALAR